MTFLHALATLWPKTKRIYITLFSSDRICTPATKGHRLVYVRQASLLLLFCFILFINAHAQSAGERADAGLTDIRPLKIGDTIPDELWHMPLQVVNHPEGKKTITLSNYKDKLIILDFWATWCGSCVSSIKEFMATKNYNDPTIAYFGVTYQDKEAINTFEEKHKLYFPTIMNNKVLSKYFPHRMIPHVIILKNDKVLSIAEAEILKEENLPLLMKGQNLPEWSKVDILDFDKTKDIHEQKSETIRRAICFKSVVLGPIPGLSSMNTYRKNENTQKILITNKSLLESMYLLMDSYWHNRIFLNVEDETKIDFLAYKGKLPQVQWLKKFGVGIEAHAPLHVTRDELFNNALHTLLHAIGYQMKVKDENVSCYVIYNENNSKSNRKENGITLKELLSNLNYQPLDKRRVPIYLIDNKENEAKNIEIDLSKIRDDNYLNMTYPPYELHV